MKEQFFLPSNDGITNIHVILWTPEDGNVKAVLQLVHGMCEYIDRYDAFASFLTKSGFAVIGSDHLGHGKSVTDEGKLGYFAHRDGYIKVTDDMAMVTEEGKKRFPGVKSFILGHSMGSFMTRRYLTIYGDKVDGAIIMGTGFIPSFLAFTGRVMANISCVFRGEFYKSLVLTALALGANNKPFSPNRTPVDWLSRNEENVDKYVADPLCGFLFTSSAYRDFFTVLQKLGNKKALDKIPKALPILITSGEEDPVGGKAACPKVLKQLQDAGLTDVSMKLYPEDRHEILNELDRAEVFEDLKTWLLEKL